MTTPNSNPIPKDITLRQLVYLMDAHALELINPAELEPHLVASVGKLRGKCLMLAAILIILVRDDARSSDTTPRIMLPGLAAAWCLLCSLPVPGGWRSSLLGAAAAFGIVAACHALARKYEDGDL